MSFSKRTLALVTIRGTMWSILSRYSGKFLVFLTTLVLARLLTQEDFGVAGYAIVVIGFLEMLSDVGVAKALIYYQGEPEAADTAFWLSNLTGMVLFALTWLAAPLVGVFFRDERAISLTRALGVIFPLTALSNTHNALLQKELAFGRKFIPDVIQAATKGVFSILFALAGYGAWSLVWGQIGGRLCMSIAYWLTLRWRPSLRFARGKARALISYGVGIISINAIGELLLNVDYLFVGRYLGAVALGVYTLAFRVPELLIKQFYSLLSRVVFPVFSRMKEEPEKLNEAFLATLRYVTLFTIPTGVGLALVAEPFVRVFFTEKWIEAVPVMRAISIYTVMLSFSFQAGDIFKARGKLAALTRLSLLRGALLLPTLWWAVNFPGTITAVGWGMALVAMVSSAINLYVTARMFHTPLRALAAAFRPAVLGGLLMAAVVIFVLWTMSFAHAWLQLTLAVFSGGVVYLASLWWLQRDAMLQAGSLLRSSFQRS